MVLLFLVPFQPTPLRGVVPVTIVKLQNTQIEFPTEPTLCTFAQIGRAQEIIDAQIPALIEELCEANPNHAWISKAKHCERTAANADEVLKILGIDTQNMNAVLMHFIARNHDWGRIIQALIDDTKSKKWRILMGGEADHGIYTVQLLTSWGALEVFNTRAQDIIRFCLSGHAVTNITDDISDDISIDTLYLIILRQCDMFTNMIERTAYYISPRGVQEQIPLMVNECARADHQFRGEAGFVSQDLFEAFIARQPFDRSRCVTYEDYIGVFFLGWTFKIVLPTLLEKIVESGFYYLIFDYLSRRGVDPDKIEAMKGEIGRYLNDYGISIAI